MLIKEATISYKTIGRCDVNKLDSPSNIIQFVKGYFDNLSEREGLLVIGTTVKYKPTGMFVCSVGTLNETTAHPRDVFRFAISSNSYFIILAHNHPSGEPEPSEADRRFTLRIRDIGNITGIPLLDHVIYAGESSYFSFREAGYF